MTFETDPLPDTDADRLAEAITGAEQAGVEGNTYAWQKASQAAEQLLPPPNSQDGKGSAVPGGSWLVWYRVPWGAVWGGPCVGSQCR